MEDLKFRRLRADEIECRVSQITAKGVSILLYKDARCDMNMLDETVGPMNWQRKHEIIDGRLYCTVSVWDPEKNMWVAKQDVGTESYTEKEKGQASDSFKRACFNWGIGRELYTAPFIYIYADKVKIEKGHNDKLVCKDRLRVTGIDYNNTGKITYLQIATDDHVAYTFGKLTDSEDRIASTAEKNMLLSLCKEHGINVAEVSNEVGLSGPKMTYGELQKALEITNRKIEEKRNE